MPSVEAATRPPLQRQSTMHTENGSLLHLGGQLRRSAELQILYSVPGIHLDRIRLLCLHLALFTHQRVQKRKARRVRICVREAGMKLPLIVL